MKIAHVRIQNETGYAAIFGDEAVLIDSISGSLENWLEEGNELSRVDASGGRRMALSSLELLAPIARPRKFLGLGANYQSHLDEIAHLGISAPPVQVWFNKQVSCVAGPYQDVLIPRLSQAVDYEGELAVVIGRRCHQVSAQEALNYVFGYMVCNDVSVRDVQLKAQTMTLGKSFDTHGPIGPWIVTADEIADPQSLRIRTWVNGELRQDGSTSEMRYSVAEQIAELSSVFTLEPGDILTTGTPAGVAAAMQPPKWLVDGDTVRIEVEAIGEICNRFVNAR